MPKTPAKKSTKTVKRATPIKAKAKTKVKAKLKAAPPPARGFMWKALKRKEEERKKLEANGGGKFFGPTHENRLHDAPARFTKFAGPRRRAA